MTEARMPKPGDAITEAEVITLYVEEGGTVDEGEPLYAIATDKVEMDVEAPASGVVHWKVDVDTTHDIGTLVAEIE